MCIIYSCITHVVLQCNTCEGYTLYMCIADGLQMYYRCMNYMCSTLKIPHMYYTCNTFSSVSTMDDTVWEQIKQIQIPTQTWDLGCDTFMEYSGITLTFHDP